jgi:hypothetical protein
LLEIDPTTESGSNTPRRTLQRSKSVNFGTVGSLRILAPEGIFTSVKFLTPESHEYLDLFYENFVKLVLKFSEETFTSFLAEFPFKKRMNLPHRSFLLPSPPFSSLLSLFLKKYYSDS